MTALNLTIIVTIIIMGQVGQRSTFLSAPFPACKEPADASSPAWMVVKADIAEEVDEDDAVREYLNELVVCDGRLLHPPPSTLHPPPSALRPPPSTFRPPPCTLHLPPSALRPPP